MVEDNQSKNTTILAMDVVGYSAKMNQDERGTTEKLKKARIILEYFLRSNNNESIVYWIGRHGISYGRTFN